jgi:hypothetical protein
VLGGRSVLGTMISAQKRKTARLRWRSQFVKMTSLNLSELATALAWGTYTVSRKRRFVSALAVILLLPLFGFGASDDTKIDSKAASAAIISKYVQATQSNGDAVRNVSMQVDIQASVPKLKEEGRLRALRKISKVGQITYHVLGFQGNNTVKSQVIARFLQAEQQGQGDDKLGITPANYKFKLKGQWPFEGRQAYLFQISPRTKRVGLFKGEIWVDTAAYLPVFEKGRFVKNPSVFFKRVVFDRGFAIENGVAIPRYMNSTIDTRVIGKVEITITYSKFSQNSGPEAKEAEPAVAAVNHQ